MCRLCKNKKVIVESTSIGAVFRPCPNCRAGSDLTPVIAYLEQVIEAGKVRLNALD
ncbi:MAG: hypothetical protein ACQEUS_13605 [Bacillota bacterium]